MFLKGFPKKFTNELAGGFFKKLLNKYPRRTFWKKMPKKVIEEEFCKRSTAQGISRKKIKELPEIFVNLLKEFLN